MSFKFKSDASYLKEEFIGPIGPMLRQLNGLVAGINDSDELRRIINELLLVIHVKEAAIRHAANHFGFDPDIQED
jgi:hypothetical protein